MGKYQPVKQDDIVIYNNVLYKATKVSIKKDKDIFKFCTKCGLHKTTKCGFMWCKDTYFKKSKGGL